MAAPTPLYRAAISTAHDFRVDGNTRPLGTGEVSHYAVLAASHGGLSLICSFSRDGLHCRRPGWSAVRSACWLIGALVRQRSSAGMRCAIVSPVSAAGVVSVALRALAQVIRI